VKRQTVYVIDSSNQLLDLLLEILVCLKIVPAWNCHLQKDHVSDKLRIQFEEFIEGVQLLRYAFDTIQPINAQDDFCAAEAISYLAEGLLNTRLFQSTMEFGWLDADGEGVGGNLPVAA
jgi:hypothetical protein